MEFILRQSVNCVLTMLKTPILAETIHLRPLGTILSCFFKIMMTSLITDIYCLQHGMLKAAAENYSSMCTNTYLFIESSMPGVT